MIKKFFNDFLNCLMFAMARNSNAREFHNVGLVQANTWRPYRSSGTLSSKPPPLQSVGCGVVCDDGTVRRDTLTCLHRVQCVQVMCNVYAPSLGASAGFVKLQTTGHFVEFA